MKLAIYISFIVLLALPQGLWARGTTATINCASGSASVATAIKFPPAATQTLKPNPGTDLRAFLKRPTFTIGTFNVLNLFHSTGRYEPQPDVGKRVKVKDGEAKPAAARNGIAKMILDAGYDVVALQEVENIQAAKDFCAKELGGKYRPLLIEGNDSRGIDVCVLVKSNSPLEFKYESHKNEPWSNSAHPDQSKVFSRDLPGLTAYVPGSSQPLFKFYAGHQKSKRTDSNSDPESNIIREAQADRAADIINDFRGRHPNVPVFVGADFNDNVNTADAYKPLREKAQMKDAFDVSRGEKLAVDDARRITHTYHPRGGTTQKQQLDAIIVSPEGHDLVIESKVNRYQDESGQTKKIPDTYDERSTNPSDHFPIQVTLDLQAMLKKAGLSP